MVQGLNPDEEGHFRRALALGAQAKAISPPNPWVGCVIVSSDGVVYEGSTEAAGGKHAEEVALQAAGAAAKDATAYVTLEPCAHQGRRPPCATELVNAGIVRVVIGVSDPDSRVSGKGAALLRDAGVKVSSVSPELTRQTEELLAPYLVQRRTGRPYVILKLAATLDGATAAPDGSSQWITGEAARQDAHKLRAASDAIIVGAGTVRADDPSLTVRHVDAPRGNPQRIVLGTIPNIAKVRPARSHLGSFAELLDGLGVEGMIQVLVEGGASVAHQLHESGLVDRYVIYLAPALMGGDDAKGLFSGPGAPNIAGLWRGRIVKVSELGADLRIDLVPATQEVSDATPV